MQTLSPPGSPAVTAFLTQPLAIARSRPGLDSVWDNFQAGSSVHLSIIVPTYNEKENIAVLVVLLHQHLSHVQLPVGPSKHEHAPGSQPAAGTPWWEIVVVDDNSPDGTAEVVRELQRDALFGPHIQLVQRPGKLGLGTAYMAGLQKAKGQWIVLMDADLSHHPKYLARMLSTQAASGCDVVSGTRYKTGGGVSGWDLKRKVTSRGANLLAATLLGTRQSDLTGSYRLYRRTCLEDILKQTTCRGYAFQMEVAVRVQHKGYYVEEVPIVFVDRLYGISKLGPGEFVGFLAGLLRLLIKL